MLHLLTSIAILFPMTPENIGRYQIKSELGRGGQATVYRAFDPNFMPEVAIKVLPPDLLNDPQFRARFEKEAMLIAQLEHSAIVPLYDYGEHEGQLYIVMRYMAGGSLTERLESGTLSLEETTRVISSIAPGLDAAHKRGIIHRDIKPGNILFDQYGQAFLSDFGIARQTEQDITTLTGGNIIGTPAYMSPEQIQGDKNIDGRSDIYSLGVVIYQMLSGQVPYEADTAIAVLVKHISEPTKDVREVRPSIPKGYAEAVTKAMAKTADERYASASDLAKVLNDGLKHDQTVLAGKELPEKQIVADDETVYAKPPTPDEFPSNTLTATPPGEQKGVHLPSWSKRLAAMFGLILTASIIIYGVGLDKRGEGVFAFLAAATPTPTPTASHTPQPAVSLTPSITPTPIIATNTLLPTDTPILPTHTPILEPVFIEPYCEMFDESPIYAREHQPVILWWRWDASTQAQIRDHMAAASYEVKLDGERVAATTQSNIEYLSDKGWYRVAWYAEPMFLSPGNHTASRYLEWNTSVYDGWEWYGPGTDVETEFHICQIIVE